MFNQFLYELRAQGMYVGTHGISPFGNSGFNPNAIRVGGTTMDMGDLTYSRLSPPIKTEGTADRTG